MTLKHLPPAFCWTKMGTESGETLATIILRKEWERRLGGGRFLWGIGQSLGDNPETAANLVGSLMAIFSPMPSKPKAIDVEPGEVVLWNGWLDNNGQVRSLPAHTFVTSRARLPSGKRKQSHYALVCSSLDELATDSELEVHPYRLTNVGTGKGLGASQVTAVVACAPAGEPASGKSYPVAFAAELEAPYFVRLAQPTLLKRRDVAEVGAASRDGDFDGWVRLVKRLRSKPVVARTVGVTPDLFDFQTNDGSTSLFNSMRNAAAFA
ncbi:hypothetical protein AYM40_20950 [Paraburkholderia phytofirmans OLGA172]|uniref:Uncharacterized protein n=1 Tax=Paraburkholderia phytofirmans OLGA172 TaxID=1417228 RepID=A0A160FVK8_9BURK|nr:hypothetical protein [Paraburkholderia phytofirmans]ANB77399.1 hypothetical protein AYM40_20950 [Paraburkholderia phytofirmans OLGA172]